MFINSYNCRGLINDLNKDYIQHLLLKCDVLFIQEHWLLDSQCNMLQRDFKKHIVFAKSGMEEHELLIGRPYGGSGIFISKQLNCNSLMINCDSLRLCAVLSDFHNFTVLFISVYMPCDSHTNTDEYNYILNIILALQATYRPDHIICGGDYNTDFSRTWSAHTQSLSKFIDDNLFFRPRITGSIDYTYRSDINGATSTIDHIIFSQQLAPCVSKCYVVDDINNISDHLPVCINVNMDISKLHESEERKYIPKPKWDTATEQMKTKYRIQLDTLLIAQPLPINVLHCSDFFCKLHCITIHNLYVHIINSLLRAAQLSIKFTDPDNKSHKPPTIGWNDSVKPLQCELMHWNKIWKGQGRPRVGFVRDMYTSARRSYHRQRKFIVRRQKRLRKQKIAFAFIRSNTKNYWSQINKIRGRSRKVASIIEGYSKYADIADCFALKYKVLFNSVPSNDSDMHVLYNKVCIDVCNVCTCTNTAEHCHCVSAANIESSIRRLKPGKSDGHEGLTSDYFRNGTPLLFEYLSCLFSCMIRHNYVPQQYGISSIIPIHKGSNLKISETKNYRAIALSSLFSKVLENCVSIKQAQCLSSDPLQFAYKAGSSTIQCTSTIIEIITHYISGGGGVYMCMVDASKAFDRINLLTLYRKLDSRGMCPIILRFLMHSYSEQSLRVNWNGVYSKMFTPSNGVKQGGNLSPILFNVYMDNLIQALKDSGLGCHINNHYVGCFIYADDVTLLAPTAEALEGMLRICSNYAAEHDILFNPSKTKCMYFDNSYGKNNLYNRNIQFMDNDIDFVDKCILLGVHISRNIFDKDIHSTVNTFYRKCNEVKMDFAGLTSDIKSSLLMSYCMCLYGSQLWNYSSVYVSRMFVAWRKVIRLLWNVPYQTHCNILPVLSNTLPVDLLLEKRCIKFIWSCINSNNPIVKSVTLSSINSPKSTLGENYRHFSYKFSITPHQWQLPMNYVLNSFNAYVLLNVFSPPEGYFVRELCISRDLGNESVLTCREMSQMIEHICTI